MSSSRPGVNFTVPYHEVQSSFGRLCLLHTLNAVAGKQHFSKRDLDAIAEQLADENPERSFINPHRNLFGLGDYDVNVLIVALKQLDIRVEWFDKRKSIDQLFVASENLVGLVVNEDREHGWMFWKGRHWFPILHRNGLWWNCNSQLETPHAFQATEHVLSAKRNIHSQELTSFLEDIVKNRNAEVFSLWS